MSKKFVRDKLMLRGQLWEVELPDSRKVKILSNFRPISRNGVALMVTEDWKTQLVDLKQDPPFIIKSYDSMVDLEGVLPHKDFRSVRKTETDEGTAKELFYHMDDSRCFSLAEAPEDFDAYLKVTTGESIDVDTVKFNLKGAVNSIMTNFRDCGDAITVSVIRGTMVKNKVFIGRIRIYFNSASKGQMILSVDFDENGKSIYEVFRSSNYERAVRTLHNIKDYDKFNRFNKYGVSIIPILELGLTGAGKTAAENTTHNGILQYFVIGMDGQMIPNLGPLYNIIIDGKHIVYTRYTENYDRDYCKFDMKKYRNDFIKNMEA